MGWSGAGTWQILSSLTGLLTYLVNHKRHIIPIDLHVTLHLRVRGQLFPGAI